MKRALIVVALLALAACGQVRPGHVGIKVNQFGSGAGVRTESLGVGTYFTPFGTNIIEYPVYTQTYTYSQNANEGSGATTRSSPSRTRTASTSRATSPSATR